MRFVQYGTRHNPTWNRNTIIKYYNPQPIDSEESLKIYLNNNDWKPETGDVWNDEKFDMRRDPNRPPPSARNTLPQRAANHAGVEHPRGQTAAGNSNNQGQQRPRTGQPTNSARGGGGPPRGGGAGGGRGGGRRGSF